MPSCARYKKKLSSKNKFFKHLKAYGHTKKSVSRLSQNPTFSPASQQTPRISVSSPPPTQLAKTQPVVQP